MPTSTRDIPLCHNHFDHGRVEITLLATDLQCSVLATVDETAPKHLAYTAYGHRPAENGLLSLLGFNGERPDPVTGHYLLGNGYRAFNPVLTRFNSPDNLSPFGKGGLNAYCYCAGNPIHRVDPSGHWFLKLLGRKTFLNKAIKNIEDLKGAHIHPSTKKALKLSKRELEGSKTVEILAKIANVSPEEFLFRNTRELVDKKALPSIARGYYRWDDLRSWEQLVEDAHTIKWAKAMQPDFDIMTRLISSTSPPLNFPVISRPNLSARTSYSSTMSLSTTTAPPDYASATMPPTYEQATTIRTRT